MNNSDYNSIYNVNFQFPLKMDPSQLPYPPVGHQTSANTNEAYNNNQFSSQQVNSQQFQSQHLNSQQLDLQPLNSLWPNSLWPNSPQFLQGPQLQGLSTTMGFQPRGNLPQGPNGSFQGMYRQPHQPQPSHAGYHPSLSQQRDLIKAFAWRQHQLLVAQRRDLHRTGTQDFSRLQSHGLPLQSGNPNQVYNHQPVQPVLPQPQPYDGTQHYGGPMALGTPHSGGLNQLGRQEPVQPVQYGPQTQPYCQPQQYGRLAEQATQPSAARTGDSSENPICVGNDGAENPAVPQSTAVDCEPTNTTAPADTAPAPIHALHMYYEVTALIQAQKWDGAPLEFLRKTLVKAVQYWPGVYDCSQKRWFLHKERPQSFFCKERWGTGAMTWGWLIDEHIRKLEESVAKERESLLVAPINGAVPANNNQRKRSSNSDSDAGSKPAAKRAKKKGQTSAGRPFSEPTPATAAPKKNARRKSSAQVAPKRAGKKASTQAATPQAGPRVSEENKTSSQPRAPRARCNKGVADLAPVSAETSAEPSGKVETSAASPAPMAETAASQASTEPDCKESGAMEIATADSVPVGEQHCWTDALFEEKTEPLQEQTDVPAENEAAVKEALPAKDVEPENIEPKAIESEDTESEDDAFTTEIMFHLADSYKEQGFHEVAEDDEESFHEPELSYEPTSEVCLAIDEEEYSEEPTNDVYLTIDEESEESEEE